MKAAQKNQQPIFLFLLVLVSLFFVPDRPLDPWGLFNIHKLLLFVFVLSCLQLVNFFISPILGAHKGMLLTGFLGGLVSSTAVFLSLTQKKEGQPSLKAASAIMSVLAMLIESVVILYIFSTELFSNFMYPFFVMMAACMVISYWLSKKQGYEKLSLKNQNALDFFAAFKMALLISLIFTTIALAKKFIGTQATLIVAFLSGLFELHAVIYASANMFNSQQMTLHETSQVIGIAIVASFISKFLILLLLSRDHFKLLTSFALFLTLLSGVMAFFSLHLF